MLTIATERSDRLAEDEPVATPTVPAGPLWSPGARARDHQSERPGHLRGLRPRGYANGASAHLPSPAGTWDAATPRLDAMPGAITR